ncbi:UNVERIFIED_CONTAM: hypothetical protein K2H54_046764 [Gekko kuhli]
MSTPVVPLKGGISESEGSVLITISKQAKEFLEYVYEEPLIDIQQENPMLYRHVEGLATVVRLRQQLKSLRAYLFSCRAAVAEDLRRSIKLKAGLAYEDRSSGEASEKEIIAFD